MLLPLQKYPPRAIYEVENNFPDLFGVKNRGLPSNLSFVLFTLHTLQIHRNTKSMGMVSNCKILYRGVHQNLFTKTYLPKLSYLTTKIYYAMDKII